MQLKNIGIIFLLSFVACSSTSSVTGGSSATVSGTTARQELLEDVQSWAYQLTEADVDEISDSKFDLMVMDFSHDGTVENAYTNSEVTQMKGSGSTQKLLISYMSVGEAEDYRTYFDADATYLDEENPLFEGNFKVHYWEQDWQAVIFEYLDQIIAAGFDGVYLDIIDAYEYFGPGGESGLERSSAAADMVDFIVAIAERARESDDDFLIFPQNGSAVAIDAGMEDEYFAAIDGIGVEDTFYFGDEENDNDLDEQTDVTENLEEFVARGKTVLAVDYLTESSKIDDFYERALDNSYIPYCSIRELDVLTVNDGHEPE